jgi:hypothetical protein
LKKWLLILLCVMSMGITACSTATSYKYVYTPVKAKVVGSEGEHIAEKDFRNEHYVASQVFVELEETKERIAIKAPVTMYHEGESVVIFRRDTMKENKTVESYYVPNKN